MKKANVVLLVLAAAGLLAACGGPASSESEPEEPSSTSTVEPTPSSSTEEPTPSSSDSVDPVEHQAPYTKDLAEGTIERAYDDKFDLMHDDFSGETPNGVASEVNAPTLRVLVDSANGDFPNTADASIYKTARDGGFASFDVSVDLSPSAEGSVCTVLVTWPGRGETREVRLSRRIR